MLKAALNGVRQKSDHPNIPISDLEILQDIKSCFSAGADMIHIHVRDEEGIESLFTEDINRIFSLLRKELPKAKIGISSGEWILPDSQKRIEAIKLWEMFPDFVSVNIDEEPAEEVIKILTGKNVGVEIGISSIDEAEKFSKSKLAEKCLRVLIEPMEKNTTETDKIVSEIETVLDKNNILLPRLLHGFNELAWHLIKSSVIKGYSTRIGFEDTLFLPNGKIANSNAELVKEAFKILKS